MIFITLGGNEEFSLMRINGNKKELEEYLEPYEKDPKYKLEILEPIGRAHKDFTVLFKVSLVPVKTK